MIEVIVIVAAVLVLAAIYVSRPQGCKVSATQMACVNNLKQVAIAFRVWAQDHDSRYSMMTPLNRGGTREFAATGVVAPHFQVMSNELNTPKILRCPADKTRSAAAGFSTGFADAHISYFVSLDAEDTLPYMFLAGDADLCRGISPVGSGLFHVKTNGLVWSNQRHIRRGNVALADGSVQSFSDSALTNALQNTGYPGTFRLALP